MTEFVDVVIVGAGISGISAAWHLQDRCPNKSYLILERRDDLGGTWDLFKYPGIRSDSDMFTLGFRFKPWRSAQSIADGASIKAYIKEAADENGIDKHIRFGHRVVAADWSDADNRWTVTVERDGEQSTIQCAFVIACSGYYDYDEGYTPEFPGMARLPGHDRPPAALARGSRLRRQEDRRDRQRRHRGDTHSRAGGFGRRPCHHAAALAHLCRRTARRRPGRRAGQQVAAGQGRARREPLEGRSRFSTAQYQLSQRFPATCARRC